MGKFRKLSVVLLLAFVLLSCCAVNAFAEDYTVNLEFLDYEKQPAAYEGDLTNLWIYIELKDKNSGNPVGWNYYQFDPRNLTGPEYKYTYTFTNFGTTNNPDTIDLNNTQNPTYNPATHKVSVRLYSQILDEGEILSYKKVHDQNIQLNDKIPGYQFEDPVYEPSADAPTSQTTRIYRWNGSNLYIDFNIDPASATAVQASDDYWIWVKLDHTSSDDTYFVTQLDTSSITNNTVRIKVDDWWDWNGRQLTNESFTGKENDVTVEIRKTKANKNTPDTHVGKITWDHNDFDTYDNGTSINGYTVEFLNENPLPIEGHTHDDNTLHETICVFSINLTKPHMDPALTPDQILGEAAEFGIVADTLNQTGSHTETNFAVNKLIDQSNIDIDASGDTPIPIYVGTIEGHLNLTGGTNIDVDIFTNPDYINDITILDTSQSQKTVNKYPMSPEAIREYVDELIEQARVKSQELAGKTTMTPEYTVGEFTLDTTGYDDNTTIYVNSVNILPAIASGSMKINKNPGQSIVFNISSPGPIEIKDFTVDPNDGGEPVHSDTNSFSYTEHNKRVDEVILSHITFNVINAETVTLHTAAGLFLCPNAQTVNQENGTGWILAGGKDAETGKTVSVVNSSAEWHFFRKNRNYVARGGFMLETKKNIQDASGNVLPFEDKGFEFNLFEVTINEQEERVETRIENVKADANGIIDFRSFNYTNINVPNGSTQIFNYIIREVIPDDAENAAEVKYSEANETQKAEGGFKKDGIIYNAAPILLTVTAASSLKEGSQEEYEISIVVKTGDTTVQKTTVEGKPDVYNLTNTKEFTNTKADGVFGSAAIQVQKNLLPEGIAWPANGTATFTLTGVADANETMPPMPANCTGTAPCTVQMTETDHTGAKSYGNIIYTQPGIYTYTITESTDNFGTNCWTTAPNQITVTVTVGEEQNGTLPTTVTYKVGENTPTAGPGIFTNTYDATGTISLAVDKTMLHDHWPTDGNPEFTFTIEGLDQKDKDKLTAAVQNGFSKTVTIDKDSTSADKTFGTLTFGPDELTNGTGSYTFTVSETIPSTATKPVTIAGTSYKLDESTHIYYPVNNTKTFTVNLTDNGTGVIETRINSTQTGAVTSYSVPFQNEYHKTGTFKLSVTKSFGTDGRWPVDRIFTFRLDPKDTNDSVSRTALGSSGYREATADSTHQTVAFSEFDIPDDISVIYNFTLSEVIPTNAVDNKLNGVTFISAPIDVTVKFEEGYDGTVIPIVNGKRISDTTIAFSLGTYTNSYEAAGSITLPVSKSISPNWPDGLSIDFSIAAVDGGPASADPEVTLDKDNQSGDFGAISFDLSYLKNNGAAVPSKEFQYKITETAPADKKGVSFTDTEHTVTIVVSDKGDGTLDVKLKNVNDPGLSFTNTYAAEGKIKFAAEKELENKTLEDNMFEFILTGNKINGEKTIKNTGNAVNFAEIVAFTIDDMKNNDGYVGSNTFNYTIKEKGPNYPEVGGTQNGITYSNQVYSIAVTMSDQKDGTIKPTKVTVNGTDITCPTSPDENGAYLIDLGQDNIFTNTYTTTGSITLAVNKTMHGGHWPEGDKKFTFTISGLAENDKNDAKINSAVNAGTFQNTVTIGQNSTDAEKTFGTLTFTKDDLVNGTGSYTFKVKETIPASATEDVTIEGKQYKLDKNTHIYYSTEEKTVTINLSDNGNGTITAKIEDHIITPGTAYNIGNFENEYHKEGTFKLRVTKSFNGDTDEDGRWPKDRTFEFRLDPTDPDDAVSRDALGTEGYRTAITGEDHHSAAFDDFNIPNDLSTEYKFTLSEVIPTGVDENNKLDGVTYQSNKVPVIIKFAAKDDGAVVPVINEVEAAAPYTIEIGEYNNTYDASGSISLKVTKAVSPVWPKDLEINFSIEPVDGAPSSESSTSLTLKKSSTEGTFGNIPFTLSDMVKDGKAVRSKQFKYKISETVVTENGITYNDPVRTVIVEVNDDGNGKLTANVLQSDVSKLNFKNDYNAAGSIKLNVTKGVSPYWPDGLENVKFAIVPADTGAPAPSDPTSITLTKDQNSGSFGDINFNLSDMKVGDTFVESKEFRYTISETVPQNKKGVTYEEPTRTITIVVTDNGKGKLETKVKEDDAARLNFTNSYDASGSLVLSAIKDFNRWDVQREFIFKLEAKQGNTPAEEKIANIPETQLGQAVYENSRTAVFPRIPFTYIDKDKEFIFILSEVPVENQNISGTPEKYQITVIPIDNQEGLLVPKIKVDDGEWITLTDPVNGVFSYSVGTFTNTYTASGEAEISVTKAFSTTWPAGLDHIDFTITALDNAPEPEKAKVTATKDDPVQSFGKILFDLPDMTNADGSYTAAKDFKYEITEVVPQGAKDNVFEGVTYDPNPKTVTVTVTDDRTGVLKTKVIYSSENAVSETFTNSYETKGSLVLSAEKAFNRWDVADSFTFKLETDYIDYVDQKTVRKDSPTAVFDQIDFSKSDDGIERTFTISEVIPKNPIAGVTYADPIVISVTPVDNGDGTMTLYSSGQALSKDENGVCKLNVGTLTNTYRSAGAGVIRVAKVLEGREWNKDDTYTFTLEAVNGAPMPGKNSVTITKDTAHTAAFEEIPFSEPGTYEYTVKETGCSVKGVACDETVKTVTFKVERNEKGEIVAAADSSLIQDVSFTNTYNAEGKLNLKSSKRIINNDDTREKHQLPFVLYHKYGDKNDYPDGEPVIERIVEVEDGILIDFDYPIYYSVDELPESEQPADGRREVLNRLVRAGYAKVVSAPAAANTEWEVGYFLTELPAIDHQLKPPDQSFDILVTISDNGTGELKVEKVMVQALDQKGNIVEPFKEVSDDKGFAIGPFQNTERKDTFIELLTGTKILEGRDLTAADNGKWSVTISSDDENAPLPQEKTVPIMIKEENGTLRGSFAFGAITFKPEHLGVCIPHDELGYFCGPKDYRYTLTESGTAEGIINGPALNFIIRVSEADDGHVQADFVDEAGNVLTPEQALAELTFMNKTRSYAAGEAEIAVEKVFNGEWPDGQEFTFTISQLNKSPMPERASVTVTKDDPSGTFGVIRITEDDMTDESGTTVTEKSFSWEIREVIPEDADPNGICQDIQYDTRVRTVTISAKIEGGKIIVLTPADHVITETFTNRKVEQEKTPEGPTFHRIKTMPETGFSALKPTVPGEQPKALNYKPLAWTLEIPSLALITDIVEVPSADGTYPVTWLGSSAGLLEGFGLPGDGHSVLTGHNHLNTMEAGPFALLQEMGIGDRIFVLDPQDQMQIFTVYANEKIAEKDIRGLEHIAERFDDSLTLITCEDERVEGGYANRRIIAAKPVDR